MRYIISSIVFLMTINVTNMALAKDKIARPIPPIIAEIQIFSQKLRFRLPHDWKHAFTDQNAKLYLVEFIPKAEQKENWTNLYSIQGHKDFNPAIKPEDVSDKIARAFYNTCPETTIYSKIGAKLIHKHEAFFAVIGCSKMPKDDKTGLKKGMAEISYYAFIKGKRDLYIIHKSVRGEGFAPDKLPKYVEQSIKDLKYFFPMELCDANSSKGTCKQ